MSKKQEVSKAELRSFVKGGGKARRNPTRSEKVDDPVQSSFEDDEKKDKTWTRRLVEGYLMHKSWYFPRKDKENAPSLKKAYAFYEHTTLPRYFRDDPLRRRAEPGERQPTALYDPFCFDSSNFIEWGIGIDQYFSSVRFIAIILFIGGVFHLPNIVYFVSDNYNPGSKDEIKLSLRASAMCTRTDWVVCEDCDPDDWNTGNEKDRFATAFNSTGHEVTLILRNMCDLDNFRTAWMNYGVFLMMTVMIGFTSWYLGAREVRFDEDKQTATDYSIVVRNPPPDVYDPDEWRKFFSEFITGQITVVTVALDNKVLLEKLIERRHITRKLEMLLPNHVDLLDEAEVRKQIALVIEEEKQHLSGSFEKFVWWFLHTTRVARPLGEMADNLFRLTNEIRELQQARYRVVNVYVTFEKEEDQRAVLAAMPFRKLDIYANITRYLHPGSLFRGKVLDIEEPAEPSAVRWLDLGSTGTKRTLMNILNFVITMGLVAGSGILVAEVRYTVGTFWSGNLVSLLNVSIPVVVEALMVFEPHLDEGDYQASLFVKIALFRWINTAFLNKMLTPFTSTLGDGAADAISAIRGILLAELYITPGARLLDVMSNVKKHLLAPRARTQELMDLNFQGTAYNLGERYTDLSKVMFVAFFYSALYPPAFFFGFMALTIQYYTDRFCLVRVWGWGATIGSELASFCREYFFTGALVAYAVVSAYAWAQFPYDGVCDPSEPKIGAAGNYTNVKFLNDDEADFLVVQYDNFVVSCDQNIRTSGYAKFPPRPGTQDEGREWMSMEQEALVEIFGLTAAAAVFAWLVYFLVLNFFTTAMEWFIGGYSPDGQDQHIDFSSNIEIFGYVPQIHHPDFLFPFLLCDVDDIDKELIGWYDASNSYDYHNLIYDVPWEGLPRTRAKKGFPANVESDLSSDDDTGVRTNIGLTKPIYSIVKHYPPEWKKKEMDRALRRKIEEAVIYEEDSWNENDDEDDADNNDEDRDRTQDHSSGSNSNQEQDKKNQDKKKKKFLGLF